MLSNNEHGYSVMNKELNAYSFEDISLETCKKYCRNGDVIAKQTPFIAGFSIRIMWHKWYKMIEFHKRYKSGNIFWVHFYWNNEYLHKTGEIVYRSELNK